MAFEDDELLERGYPYCTGWKVTGCITLFLALTGAAGVLLVPLCCEQWRNGNNVGFGVLAVLGAPCTGLSVLLAVVTFGTTVRDAVRPPLLRVTPTSLLLPDSVRGHPVQSSDPDNPQQNSPEPDSPPPHPEEIPFRAIRWVRREAGGAPGNDRLLIVHDLSSLTLEFHQSMMRTEDFDELETVLRAAVPEVFTPAPPIPPTPTPTDDV